MVSQRQVVEWTKKLVRAWPHLQSDANNQKLYGTRGLACQSLEAIASSPGPSVATHGSASITTWYTWMSCMKISEFLTNANMASLGAWCRSCQIHIVDNKTLAFLVILLTPNAFKTTCRFASKPIRIQKCQCSHRIFWTSQRLAVFAQCTQRFDPFPQSPVLFSKPSISTKSWFNVILVPRMISSNQRIYQPLVVSHPYFFCWWDSSSFCFWMSCWLLYLLSNLKVALDVYNGSPFLFLSSYNPDRHYDQNTSETYGKTPKS